jgi:hypothetical protein
MCWFEKSIALKGKKKSNETLNIDSHRNSPECILHNFIVRNAEVRQLMLLLKPNISS